ncbi:hypothetical protein [Flammeovirga pacifica]|uniref:hypothetical protein n=1 Tax=Flammeovirga pacifica TaxID=915059 RepID=UPI001114707D|nr:hypothetical protein [Flammeovirga pacifica]
MNNKKCLYCEEPILVGRSDKKFCSLSCKDAYNNQKSLRKISDRSSHEKIIHQNYKILRKLCPKGHGTVRKSTVEEMGHNDLAKRCSVP